MKAGAGLVVLRLTELASRADLHPNMPRPNHRNKAGVLVLESCQVCGSRTPLALGARIMPHIPTDACRCGWTEQQALNLSDSELALFQALAAYFDREKGADPT